MTTRNYEAMVIFRPTTTEYDLTQSTSEVEALVKKAGGRVERSEQMGRRRLAFRILRQTEGFYHLLRFDVPTAQVAELQRSLRLNEAIIRFMILTEEEVGSLQLTERSRARRPGRMGGGDGGFNPRTAQEG